MSNPSNPSAPVQDDPFNTGANPTIRTPEWFGQIVCDAFYCVLEKGRGKVPFDGQVHDPNKRLTAIKLSLIPLPEHKSRDITREYVAEFGAWPKVTLASLRTAWPASWGQVSLRTLNYKWAKIALVEDGTTYTDKNTGETKPSLTIKFVALYGGESECRNAYLSTNGNGTNGNGNGNVQQGQAAQQHGIAAPSNAPASSPAAAAANGNDKDRATALEFLKVIVKEAAGDRDRIAQRIAGMPMMSKYFTVESNEVKNLVADFHFGNL